MWSIYILLDYITNFLPVDVVLLKKRVFLFIRSNVKNVVYVSRQKNSFALAQAIWFYNISHLFLIVGLVL